MVPESAGPLSTDIVEKLGGVFEPAISEQ